MGGVSVAVAIIVGLVASFIQSFGLTLQRKSHVQEDLKPHTARRRPVRRPLWLLGFAIYITSNVFSTIFQLDTLPIVILAPLGAVSLIFNALLAKIILGDTFGRSSIIGTTLVALGAVLIAVFGVVQEVEHSLDELLRLWRRGPFLAFFSIIAVIVTITLVAAHIVAWHTQRQLTGRISLSGRDTPPPSLPPSNYASPHSPPPIPFRSTYAKSRRWSSPAPTSPTNAQFAIPEGHIDPKISLTTMRGVRFASKSPTRSITLDLNVSGTFSLPNTQQQRRFTLVGLAFAAASGTLSGMSLVLAKAAVELLVITIDYFRTGRGSNEFARAESWFLVVGLGLGAVLQLVYLNYSLTFASPALICPLAFCFFNLSSIFDGLVFYDQFGRLQNYQIGLVSLGVAVLLLGVWVVSRIEPTGQGGVDVGTWVEEEGSECDELDAAEGATLLGGDHMEEPDPMDELGQPSQSPTSDRTRPQWPHSPPTPSSPMSPVSPTRRRSRGPRYGTLLPEYSHSAAPAGFSIGIGAASPGFVLRPGSMGGNGIAGHRRGRTQSEGQAGIADILRGDHGQLHRPEEGHDVASEPETREDQGGSAEHHSGISRSRKWWKGLLGAGRSDEGRIRLTGDRQMQHQD